MKFFFYQVVLRVGSSNCNDLQDLFFIYFFTCYGHTCTEQIFVELMAKSAMSPQQLSAAQKAKAERE